MKTLYEGMMEKVQKGNEELVAAFFEDAPLLKRLPFVITEFRSGDTMQSTVVGCNVHVLSSRLNELGLTAEEYFNRKQRSLLRHTGKTIEQSVFYNYLVERATDDGLWESMNSLNKKQHVVIMEAGEMGFQGHYISMAPDAIPFEIASNVQSSEEDENETEFSRTYKARMTNYTIPNGSVYVLTEVEYSHRDKLLERIALAVEKVRSNTGSRNPKTLVVCHPKMGEYITTEEYYRSNPSLLPTKLTFVDNDNPPIVLPTYSVKIIPADRDRSESGD